MSKYMIKKAHAREIAITWQASLDSTTQHSWEWCITWQNRLERIAKKYGLLREFRENGIL